MMQITSGDVHVWHGALDIPYWQLAEYQQYLSPNERERANRYVMPVHQARFAAGRGILRTILSRYTDTPPQALTFRYGAQGKPDLHESPLRFNVAHSENRLLIGLTVGREIGIDIEQMRDLPDLADMAKRFFPPDEAVQFQSTPSHQRCAAFYRTWTRIEAVLKASGEGIGGLRSVDVTIPAHWTVCEIDAPTGFLAALAVEGTVNGLVRNEV